MTHKIPWTNLMNFNLILRNALTKHFIEMKEKEKKNLPELSTHSKLEDLLRRLEYP